MQARVLSKHTEEIFDGKTDHMSYLGANPTITRYDATSSLVRFENRYIFLGYEKRSSLLKCWRCSCKFETRRIGSCYAANFYSAGIVSHDRGIGSSVAKFNRFTREPTLPIGGHFLMFKNFELAKYQLCVSQLIYIHRMCLIFCNVW
jgi:hypothetical protein